MIIAIAIFGAMVGWSMTDFDGFGFLVGGFIGLIFGWILRRAIRAQVKEATGGLQAQIDALLAEQGGVRHPAENGPVVAAATVPISVPVTPGADPLASPAPVPRADDLVAIAPPPFVPAEPGFVATMIATAFGRPRAGCSAATRLCASGW